MAREGLRTLVVAKKSLSEEQYQDFEVQSETMDLKLKLKFRHIALLWYCALKVINNNAVL